MAYRKSGMRKFHPRWSPRQKRTVYSQYKRPLKRRSTNQYRGVSRRAVRNYSRTK